MEGRRKKGRGKGIIDTIHVFWSPVLTAHPQIQKQPDLHPPSGQETTLPEKATGKIPWHPRMGAKEFTHNIMIHRG